MYQHTHTHNLDALCYHYCSAMTIFLVITRVFTENGQKGSKGKLFDPQPSTVPELKSQELACIG